MSLEWLPRVVVPAAVAVAFALFRRYAPAPKIPALRYDAQQVPEPYPPGGIAATMWGIAVCFALSFFLFRWANHRWAQMDGPADLRLYPEAAIWCFFPGFAALTIPWPLTVWALRRQGRTDEADSIASRSNEQSGFDSMRIMKWFGIGLVGPIALLTTLAIPLHLSISDSEIYVGHFASLNIERFPLNQATRATLVEGYRLRDGRFSPRKNLFLDFADGRRLNVLAAGTGGNKIDAAVVQLLLTKTRLSLEHADVEEDLPPVISLQKK